LPDIYIASAKKRILQQAKEIIDSIGEKETKNPVAAFLVLPSKIKFETQAKDEKIILLLRRHWITNIPWILLVTLMIIVPLILTIVPLLTFLPLRFRLIIMAMWYLLILAFVFEKFLSWFFNVYIITDERIVDVDFVSLTYREVSETQIEKIQDITYKTGGFLKAIFDYGDVYIQTAGALPKIEFEMVPKPHKIVQILNQLMMQEQQEKVEGRV